MLQAVENRLLKHIINHRIPIQLKLFPQEFIFKKMRQIMKNFYNSFLKCFLLLLPLLLIETQAQTNPPAQSLPFSTGFGNTSFTSLPTGLASWNGLNGNAIDVQADAENSVPSGNATITAATTPQTTGGVYGYSPAADASFYIQTSSNGTNGVNQLALAINTTGCISPSVVRLRYTVGTVVLGDAGREMGVVAQYRVGTTGAWTTISGTGNPFSFTTVSGTASPILDLPAATLNQPVVQIRWAVWRGSGSGTSAGADLDDINVSCQSVTASNVTISGRVTDSAGYGIRNAVVTLTGGGLTEPVTIETNDLGYYNFSEVPAGETYIVTVRARRYTFAQPSRVVNLDDNVAEANFVADKN